MNLQFFAEGEGDAMNQLNGLLDGAGVNDPATDTGEGDPDPSTGEGEGEGEGPEDRAQPQTDPRQIKANNAFAEMRVQNATYKNLLNKLAQATGLEFTDENDLVNKLNDNAIEQLAKKQNVSPELLRRMEMLEQNSAAYEQEKVHSAALLGFQKLKDTYSLSEDELRDFAGELDEAGKNPFVTPMDIIAEYKLTHFDDITQRMIDKAVQEALATSGVADNHSTTPNSATGKGATNEEKITTLQGLNSFLDGANK